MKKTLHLAVLLLFSYFVTAQITSPAIRANFGVDADLRANFYNNFIVTGNDDWFSNGTPGIGQFVIDTNGAAAMTARYLVDPNFRKLPFFRTMRVPQLSVINNRLWIDAVYIRDYNGDAGGDSTAFVMSNKNGDNPANWSGGVTSVLDKNDIAEMMVHVRRAGPSKTDSLWFFGGISLQGTTGNRYFDFELYQTDIFYTRSTGQFSNYGPDEGHTSWEFDASGNIVKPGDVIFTAEYSSSSLTMVEARVWVHKSALSLTPATFDWGGDFDGASTSAVYGYANIRPKSAGAYYTGLQSGNGTWAGPYGFIEGGNNFLTTYSARQFMEFSVNLSKLGLDPITLLGGGACGLPFRRILVKTRSSTSFEAELKDFIGPFDFFKTAPVEAQADVPVYCGVMGASTLSVMNPLPASVYTWTTPDGRIVTDSVGTSIQVDTTGMYIVSQQLLDGCSTSSADTVLITFDGTCTPLQDVIVGVEGSVTDKRASLKWTSAANDIIQYYDVERSANGKVFTLAERVYATRQESPLASYTFREDVSSFAAPFLYYRVKAKRMNYEVNYSRIVKMENERTAGELLVYPNPASHYMTLSVPASRRTEAIISILAPSGKPVYFKQHWLLEGSNDIVIDETAKWPSGVYLISVATENGTQWRKVVVAPPVVK
ncbi:MAG TPA: T9SS type A sorting domain-containing protein [Chitinophagaceae bacterium]